MCQAEQIWNGACNFFYTSWWWIWAHEVSSYLHRLNDAVFWRDKSFVFCARQKVNLRAHRKSILRAWFFSSNQCVKLTKFETEHAISFMPPDFVILSFRIKMAFYQTHEPFIFLNLKIWIFGSLKAVCGNQPTTMAFLPLQSSKLSNLKTASISMQISVTKSQIFKLSTDSVLSEKKPPSGDMRKEFN